MVSIRSCRLCFLKIRGGGSEQAQLTELVNKYTQGGYHKSKVDAFLSVRAKEIETINNILDIVKDATIIVDDGRSGNGNKCLQVMSDGNLS